MKTLICILLALSTVCTIPGCTKDEEYNPSVLQDDEILIAVEHSVYGVDSIVYQDDRIQEITSYKKSGGELICNAKYLLERNDDLLKVSVMGERPGTNILNFTGSLISEIECPEERFKAEFHYSGELVDFLLYERGGYRDSLVFFYDRNRVNISRMEWYNISTGLPNLYFTADYSFDDKRNPFTKSIYWLVMNWKGPDDIVQYFNSNNIIGIGSHKLYYTYNERDYPLYMDIAYYGRTSYAYQTR